MGAQCVRRLLLHSIRSILAVATVFSCAAEAADLQVGDDGARTARGYARSQHRYALPAVSLISQGGRRVLLGEILPRDSPVALTFIFTRCSTVCPLLSQTLASLRKGMRAKADALRVVTISIDSEYDTPERLQAYASRYDAGASWQFYTGAPDDIDEVLHAFEAVTPIKEEHRPVTLVRAAYSDDWTRLDGTMTSDQLAKELTRIQRHR
jgi:protein SCO1